MAKVSNNKMKQPNLNLFVKQTTKSLNPKFSSMTETFPKQLIINSNYFWFSYHSSLFVFLVTKLTQPYEYTVQIRYVIERLGVCTLLQRSVTGPERVTLGVAVWAMEEVVEGAEKLSREVVFPSSELISLRRIIWESLLSNLDEDGKKWFEITQQGNGLCLNKPR